MRLYDFYFETVGFENIGHAGTEIALDDNLPVFGTAAHPARLFEPFAELLKVVIGADEARDERHHLASALFLVEHHPQTLLCGWERLFLGLLVVGVFEIGVGREDNPEAIFPILFCHVV